MKIPAGFIAVALLLAVTGIASADTLVGNTGKKNDDYDIEVTVDPDTNNYRKNTFKNSL